MAMLRMFQRKPYSLLTPAEVMAYDATPEEQHVLDIYTRQFLNGTPAEVAAALEQLHDPVGVDEVMLVVMGHSRAAQARTLAVMADHYAMS